MHNWPLPPGLRAGVRHWYLSALQTLMDAASQNPGEGKAVVILLFVDQNLSHRGARVKHGR